MDEERQMRDRFRQNLPKFVEKVDPVELIPYLPCLQISNAEEITNCQNMRSRSQAVQALHSHLIRKQNGCRQLVAALRETGETDLAALLEPSSFTGSLPKNHQPGKLEEYPIAECHSGVNKHVNRTYDGKTPINELPAKVLKVYKGLDYGGINDWHCFAAEMDCFTTRDMCEFETDCKIHNKSPGEALISSWIQKENPSLETLMTILNKIERKDLITELENITNYSCPDFTSPGHTEQQTLGNSAGPTDQQTLGRDAGPMEQQTLGKDAQPTEQHRKGAGPTELQTCRKGSDANEKLKVDLGDGDILDVGNRLRSSTQTELKMVEDKLNTICNNGLSCKDSKFTLDYESPKHLKPASGGDEMLDTSGHDTGYNTSSAVSSLGSTYGKDQSESLNSESSVEADGSMLAARSETMPEFRYKQRESGTLEFIANKDKNDETTVHRGQTVVRQESSENYGSPVQTEPSLSSDCFINLKQERLPQVVKLKNTDQRVDGTQISREADMVQRSPQASIENYVKLHTSETPTFGEFSGGTVTRENLHEEEPGSMPQNSVISRSTAGPINAELTGDFMDFGEQFKDLSLSSLMSDRSHLSDYEEDENTANSNLINDGLLTNNVSMSPIIGILKRKPVGTSTLSKETNLDTPFSSQETGYSDKLEVTDLKAVLNRSTLGRPGSQILRNKNTDNCEVKEPVEACSRRWSYLSGLAGALFVAVCKELC